MSITTHSSADVLAELLIIKGLTTRPELKRPWSQYIDYMPDSERVQDNCACTYDTTEIQGGRYMQDGVRVEHPGWQVRVRGCNFRTGRSKAAELADYLDRYKGGIISIDDSKYRVQNVSRRSGIISLGQEENDRKRRSIFTFNGIMTIGTV